MIRRKAGKQLSFSFMRARRPVQKIQRSPFEIKGTKTYFFKGQPYFEKSRRQRLGGRGRHYATLFELVDTESRRVASAGILMPIPKQIAVGGVLAADAEWAKRKIKNLFVRKSALLFFGASRGGTGGWLEMYSAGIFDSLLKSAIGYARQNGARRVIVAYPAKGNAVIRSELEAKMDERTLSILKRFGFSSQEHIELEDYWYRDLKR